MTKRVSKFTSIFLFLLAFMFVEMGVSSSTQFMSIDAYLKRWPISEAARHSAFGNGDRLFIFSKWADEEHGLESFLLKLYGPDNLPHVHQKIIDRLESDNEEERTLCIFLVRDAKQRKGVRLRGVEWISENGELEIAVQVTKAPSPLLRVVRAYFLKKSADIIVNNVRELIFFSKPQQSKLIAIDPNDPKVSTEGIVLNLPDTP